MNPHMPVKVTPLVNPHSRFAKKEGHVNKQTADMEEVLEKIKEKSRQELIENRKPKMLRRKADTQAIPEPTGFTNPSKTQLEATEDNFKQSKVSFP